MTGADGDGGLDLGDEGGLVERRLRTLGSVCAVLAAAVVTTAGTIGWTAGRAGGDILMSPPPADWFLVAFGAMLLVLLASAVHARILRRQADAEADAEADGGDEAEAEGGSGAGSGEGAGAEGGDGSGGAAPPRVQAADRLRAYSWATGVSFGMLALAAALGGVVAQQGKALFYGLVICLAALIGMVARWPRRSGFELALAGGTPAGRRGATANGADAGRPER